MIAQVAASPASRIGTSLACTRASDMRASALVSIMQGMVAGAGSSVAPGRRHHLLVGEAK